MIFYIFTAIVFIAEIIITAIIIINLLIIRKKIIKYNELLTSVQTQIKEIFVLIKEISYQYVKLAPHIVSKIKTSVTYFILENVIKMISGTLFFTKYSFKK